MAKAGPRLYLGLISGTSADGIDAALVRFATGPEVLAARTYPYSADLRARVLDLAHQAAAITLDDYAQLDVAIGRCFGDAARALLAEAGVDPLDVAAIGSHGQTIRHAPRGKFPFTLQMGDPNVIAEATGIATVADFRRADVAAGGQGAPLLPALHAAMLAESAVPRAILNLGGIANVTALVPGRPVLGFDTGPANCLMDAWSQRVRGSPRDDDGAWARSGRVDVGLLASLLDDPYFSAAPPKSTGREYFNLAWLEVRMPRGHAPEDVQATLLQLTVRSIADALRAFGLREVFGCGGGVHNGALLDALRMAMPGARVETTAALGIDPDFVEAVGFAWLARARLQGEPGNLPSVTGARGPRVLGGVYAPRGPNH